MYHNITLHHNDIYYILIIYITGILIYNSVYLDIATENVNLKQVSNVYSLF